MKCTLSCEFSNLVLLSGEVFGEDTLDRIRGIGKMHGIEVMTDGLSIMYRNPKPDFSNDWSAVFIIIIYNKYK